MRPAEPPGVLPPGFTVHEALPERYPPAKLAGWLEDARRRSLDLVDDLDDSQLLAPRLAITNPLLWEVGHLAWFQEKWVLRRQGRPSLRADADALYDSSAVAHDTRWDLPLPPREQTLRYARAVLDTVLDRLHSAPGGAGDVYFVLLAIFHEDMHGEAFAYTRQTLGYPAPRFSGVGRLETCPTKEGPHSGDVSVPGGTFLLGASPDEPFVFDNEKWAHPVEVRPFAIARAPVTQGEFASFVDAGGYEQRRFWGEEGWRWRESAGARHPLYWERQAGGSWLRRDFDSWVPLEPHRPVLHVNAHEAEAFCAWAGRRLPTEAEWEVASAGLPGEGGLARHKRGFPWGDEDPAPGRANLEGEALGCVDVAGCPAGDSAWGCRQLVGNVWEWTASDFLPYPGFVVDPYRDYSRPWFGTHRVLRGGCWATRGRLLRNTWRNFYRPDRRDVWAGFRTCALTS